MNIIVSDTTTLITLSKIDKLNLLSNLFELIYIPKAVYEEAIFKNDCVKEKILKCEFIKIKKISNMDLFKKLSKDIDKGESEAITLAAELNYPLIIDEKKGRKIAKSMNIKITGLLGIFIENFNQNFITSKETQKLLLEIKNNNFRISKNLEIQFLNFLNVK